MYHKNKNAISGNLRGMLILIAVLVCTSIGASFISDFQVSAANPYLPLWERIPDGEPRVFDDPDSLGKQRVYIYGSHDTTNTKPHCGRDHVVWSAPTDDLNDWRYEGVAFDVAWLDGKTYTTYNSSGAQTGTAAVQPDAERVLYAPDVVFNPVTGKYYMYLFSTGGSSDPGFLLFVASSDRPAGPFENPVFIPIGWGPYSANPILANYGMGGGFDPGVYVDMDDPNANGYPKIYMYCGIMYQIAVMLDGSDMSTIIPGSFRNSMGGQLMQTPPVTFFEATSVRKVGDFYVTIYAGSFKDGSGGNKDIISTLNYVYGKKPLGYGNNGTYGGIIIDNRGEAIPNPYDESETIRTYNINYGENNHGSLCEIYGQWYIFYHRHTQNGRSARQAAAEPVNIRIEGDNLIIEQAEMTSQGFELDGLNPYDEHDAGITCYTIGDEMWIDTHTYDIMDWDPNSGNPAMDWNPIVNIRNQNWVAYKYFNFGNGADKGRQTKLILTLTEGAPGAINIYSGDPIGGYGRPDTKKTLIGRVNLLGYNSDIHTVETLVDNVTLTGKKGIYLEFLSQNSDQEICKLNKLQFIQIDETPATYANVHTSSRLTIRLRAPFQLVYDTDGSAYEFLSSNKSILKVDENGLITPQRAGSATVSIHTMDGSELLSSALVNIVP
ncbi:MAG: hypothetical protein LBL49_08320 [Clostridiales Family XIII bacterium]|jgi:hypothetical protein|nr:hypothetical protein [Clostridiales Family XIII bacterium]